MYWLYDDDVCRVSLCVFYNRKDISILNFEDGSWYKIGSNWYFCELKIENSQYISTKSIFYIVVIQKRLTVYTWR